MFREGERDNLCMYMYVYIYAYTYILPRGSIPAGAVTAVWLDRSGGQRPSASLFHIHT